MTRRSRASKGGDGRARSAADRGGSPFPRSRLFRRTGLADFGDAACTTPENCLIVRAVAGLSVGLVLVSPPGKVVWLNRTAGQILGAEVSECLGRSIEQILKDPQLSAFWHDAAGQDGDYFAQLSVRWPRQLELKMHVTRCLDDEGTEIGRALLFCDVTSERMVQVELSQAIATRLLDLTSGHMPPEPVANLTHQELRILRLVGRGLGNDEIAVKTGVSPSTVRSHLKSLYRKLSLGSRAEAISYAVRNHLA